MKRLFGNEWFMGGVISLLVFFGIFMLRETGVIQGIELDAYDVLVDFNSDFVNSQPIQEILVLNIVEEDIKKYKWPISDKILADALTKIIQLKPASIGIDMYRDLPVEPGTDAFYKVLHDNKNIISVLKFNKNEGEKINPPPVIQENERIGFNDIIIDDDGTVRRNLLFLDDGSEAWYSFALRLSLLYLEKFDIYPQADDVYPDYLKLGPATLKLFESNDGSYVRADASGYQILAEFANAGRKVSSITLDEVLHGRLTEVMVKDKIVLIGITADSVKDFFYVPVYDAEGTKRMYGVFLHAYYSKQLIDLALGDAKIRFTFSDSVEYAWLFLWCLVAVVLTIRLRSIKWFILVGVSGLLILLVLVQIAFLYSMWVPVIPPAMGWVVSAVLVTSYIMTRERANRTTLMQLFSKHVSNDIAQHIWHQRDEFMENGRIKPQRLTATVLFTDLRNFTTVSEGMTPSDLIDWLNVYMSQMTQIVLNHKGVVDKYIGDAIMAVFGVPIPRENDNDIRQDAINAVDCAMEMDRALQNLNEDLVRQGKDEIGMRVGIYTGPLIAGSLGSSERMDYTVIGDTVNIASRLESYDKSVNVSSANCRILIGDKTHQIVADRYNCHLIGDAMLKGKTRVISIYQVLGLNHI